MSLVTFSIVRLRIVIASVAIACMASSLYAATLNGTIQSGGNSFSVPLGNVNVALYEATTGTPNLLAQASSDSLGHFLITSPRDWTASIFFMTAEVGVGVQFVAVLGPNLPSSVTINELTTVAASYAMAQFYQTGVIAGGPFGLRIAAGMNNNLVAVTAGSSSPVLLNSPNADETNSLRTTRTLANLLVACVNSRGATNELLSLTGPARGRRPENTAEALADLARDPAQHVMQIWRLANLYSYYAPALTERPRCVDSHREGERLGGRQPVDRRTGEPGL